MEIKAHSKIKLFITGIAMGAADIVPGVSGGTIAFISGIYEDLINTIKHLSQNTLFKFIKLDIKNAFSSIPFNFILPLGFGIVISLLSLAKIISNLLEAQPIYIWSFFFGLVLASVFIIQKRLKSYTLTLILLSLVSATIAYIISGLVPNETPNNYFTFFLSGSIAIIAMILPGISGSFILLMLGKYSQLLQAVLDRDLIRLGVFILGAAIGLAIFSKILSYLFDHYHDTVIAVLAGLMLGSLRKIWPWKETISYRINSHGAEVPLIQTNYLPEISSELFIALTIALIGALLITTMAKFDKTNTLTEESS